MIYSFSFLALEYGYIKLPEGIEVVDVRHLQDPAGKGLGPNGLDPNVSKFVLSQPEAGTVLENAINYLRATYELPDVAFGCVGGIYRSVAIAEAVGKILNAPVKHLGLELRNQGTHVWNL